MKTHYGHYATLWQSELLDLQQLLDPLSFRPRPKYISHTRHSHPHSKQDNFNTYNLPWLVPAFNTIAQVNVVHGKHMREQWFLQRKQTLTCHIAISPPMICSPLDSGCFIAITPDISNFIDGTYQSQEHNIKSIGCSLNLTGIGDIDWKFININSKP
jgi:hypothetical protein